LRSGYLIIAGLFLVLAGCLCSCEKFEGSQTIPAYIRVDSFRLEPNSLVELGVPTHRICDVWVYVDDQNIGAFELPAERIPILEEGYHKLTLIAGIKYNAMSGTRGPYPFFVPYIDTAFRLIIDSIISVNPNTTYYNSTWVAWFEDFEDGTISLASSTDSDTSLFLYSFTEPHPLYGNYCAASCMTGDMNLMETATFNEDVTGIELPKTSAPVFLEMEYKTNYTLTVGLFIIDEDVQIIRHPIVVLNPTSGEWKKVYVNMTPTVSDSYYAEYFNVFFRVERSNTTDTAEIYLDNLKLITNVEPK
jgi:hypothetical protein